MSCKSCPVCLGLVQGDEATPWPLEELLELEAAEGHQLLARGAERVGSDLGSHRMDDGTKEQPQPGHGRARTKPILAPWDLAMP